MRAIATTLIVLATATAGCVTPSYRTDVYGPPSTATYYATAPTYVYAATPKQSCEAAGGRWRAVRGWRVLRFVTIVTSFCSGRASSGACGRNAR